MKIQDNVYAIFTIRIYRLKTSNQSSHINIYLKRGDRRVRIFSAHNNWWATPEVSLLLPYQRSAKVFLIFLRQGVKTMYYFKNMHSKLLKCAK